MTGFLCSVYAVDSRTAKKDRQWVCPLPPRDRTDRLQSTGSLFRLHSASVSKNFGSKRIDLRPNSPSTANLIGPTYRSSSEGWPIHRCGLWAHWHSHSRRQFRIYCKATRTSLSHPWVSKAESAAPIRPPTSQNLPSAAGVRSCADGFLSGTLTLDQATRLVQFLIAMGHRSRRLPCARAHLRTGRPWLRAARPL